MTRHISSPQSPLLFSLLLVLGALCLTLLPRAESRRFGFPTKTLHVPDNKDDDGRTIVLEPENDVHSGAQTPGAAENDAESDSRQERRRRRSVGSDTAPPKVTIADLNKTSHKVVVHWAGEGSEVIVALATTILPSS